MSISKQGVWKNDSFDENGVGTCNYFGGTFTNISSTATFSSNQYTISSPVSSSSWGSQICIPNDGKVKIPYGCLYRISMEVQVPTAHNIVIDINNRASGGTNWAGNDNDLTSTRTATTFSIPANTWTTITWGSSNAHASNTNHEDILVYDYIGLVNSSDSAATTWYIRNPKINLGRNIYTNAGVSKDTNRATQFYEI